MPERENPSGSGTVKKSLLIIIVALALLGLGAGGFTYLRNRTEADLFRTVMVERGNIDRFVTATGTLNPVVSVNVGTQVSGTIKELYADYNSRVKKGQLLARLDPDTFKAQLSKSQAELETAGKNLEKGRSQLEDTRISLDNARAQKAQEVANLAKSEAGLLSEQANLEKTRVLAKDAKIKLGRVGRLVREGIMAASEKDTAQANYNAAQAQVRAASGQVGAAQAQVEASKAQLEVARIQIKSARAKLKSAEANLNYLASKIGEAEANVTLAKVNLQRTIIRSPITGVVVSRDVDLGQTVAASFQSPTLFVLAGDLTKMEVVVSTDEADVGSINLGQQASFTVDAFPEEEFKGGVTEIRLAPLISQNVVTYSTLVTADNPELKLKPGMTASVSILVDRKEDVLRIPNAALRFIPPDAGKILKAAQNSSNDRRGAARGSRPWAGGRGRGGSGFGWRRGDSLANQPLKGTRPKRQRIWIMNEVNKPWPAWVLIGISDGSYTELVAGQVREGQRVIVGQVSKGRRQSRTRGPRGFGRSH
ncbi:MAG: efflux RND transporter periplasmic adaptor subunit [Thermodesulfobacteriota bacterium]